jgi:acetyl esterase/lipase
MGANRMGLVLAWIILVATAGAAAQEKPARPVFDTDGTVHVPAFDLPPSGLSSPEAKAAQAARAKFPGGTPRLDLPIATIRSGLEAQLAPQVERMKQVYSVDIVEQTIGGVPTHVLTPHGKPVDSKHILINLHGGGFSMCAGACAMLESIPIAALGAYKVITVDYRMGPEAKHPAALEDVEKVYREVLKSYKPKSVGIYGCSAGGALSAETAAWLPKRDLPEPGAIGIFGSGGVRFHTGDSAYVAANIDGSLGPAPSKTGENSFDPSKDYFSQADMNDPVISPAKYPEVVAKFPPTLIITGTRAADMSPAIVTNSALIKARVPSRLIVGEAMGHCYIYQADLPEARDAHQATVDFFREYLK